MGRWLPLVFTLLLTISPLVAGEPKYKPLPWHVAGAFLYFGDRKDIRTIEVDCQLFDPIPDPVDGKRHRLFVVPLAGNLCGKEYYAGAGGRGFDTGEKGNKTYMPEPDYVFTQFGTDSPSAVLPAKGSYHLLSDHEGPLASLRRPATHDKGLYTFKLSARKLSKEAKGGDRTEVEFTVTKHADGSVAQVGKLIFEGAEAPLQSRVTTFCEVVQGRDEKANRWRQHEDNPVEQTPAIRYAVGNWRIDGESVTPHGIEAIYREDVPQRAKVYRLKECPLKELTKATDKALAGEDTLIFVLSEEVHQRSGGTIQLIDDGRAVREVLKLDVATAKRAPTTADKPIVEKPGVGAVKPSPPGGGEAKPYK